MSQHTDLEIEDFDRVPKKHKNLRKDGEIVSQSLLDIVRVYLLKKHNQNSYGINLPDHIVTYHQVCTLVGKSDASKVIKQLVTEGFIEKIVYPKDEPAVVESNDRTLIIIFSDTRWICHEHRLFNPIYRPQKIKKSIRKYFRATSRGWWKRSSTLSKKAKNLADKERENYIATIEWDEIGYRLVENEITKSHEKRLGLVEVEVSSKCPNCGKTLPFKGRHGIYNRGHDKGECSLGFVERILDE